MSQDETKRSDEAVLKTSWGAPVADNMNSTTAGRHGPILLSVRAHGLQAHG